MSCEEPIEVLPQFENGCIEALQHTDFYGNRIHVIPDVASASVYVPEHGSHTATLDDCKVVSDELREQNIGVALLGIVDANLQSQEVSKLDTTLSDLEVALYFQAAFGDHRVKVERHNARTMEFEDSGMSLGGLIVFFQTSPLRRSPHLQHTFRLTAQLTDPR